MEIEGVVALRRRWRLTRRRALVEFTEGLLDNNVSCIHLCEINLVYHQLCPESFGVTTDLGS